MNLLFKSFPENRLCWESAWDNLGGITKGELGTERGQKKKKKERRALFASELNMAYWNSCFLMNL